MKGEADVLLRSYQAPRAIKSKEYENLKVDIYCGLLKWPSMAGSTSPQAPSLIFRPQRKKAIAAHKNFCFRAVFPTFCGSGRLISGPLPPRMSV